jgi:hypothetical protein
MLGGGTKDKEHAMSEKLESAIAVVGIDIGKNSFHVVGHDARGAIVLRQKWSRGQVEPRLANIPPCLIGMEACVGAHHLSRKLAYIWVKLNLGTTSEPGRSSTNNGHDARFASFRASVPAPSAAHITAPTKPYRQGL